MITIADLLALLHDEFGLALSPPDAARPLHELPGWDSLYLLRLVTLLEARTGRGISVIDLLEAPTLAAIHDLAG